MYYTVGDHYNLEYLNKPSKKEVAKVQPKKSFSEAVSQHISSDTEIQPGTSFIFKDGKLARQIPVVSLG